MKKVRVIFENDGLTRFISHLDLSRAMQFSLRRSDLPVWYTEGFHQHLYLTFSNPLSLGFINRYGIMEFKLTDDDFDVTSVAGILNSCLPDGIRAIESYESDRKFSEIAFSDYEVTFDTDAPEKIEAAFKGELIITKRGKAGEREVDVAPYVKGLHVGSDGERVKVTFRLPSDEAFSVNPGALMDAVKRVSCTEMRNLLIARTKLTDKNGKIFR